MHRIPLQSAAGPRAAKIAVSLFFAAFLTLGLLTAADYGQPWDEQDEMDILRMNLWEYARWFHADQSAFEARAAQDSLSINALSPISESVERDHGVSALYPLAPVVMSETVSENLRTAVWHMYCWVLFTLGAYALYACCRELGLSRGAGLLAVLFLLLSPRFFAEGHYNNKDVVLMSLTLCVLWRGLALMRRPSVIRALSFAFFGALAANTKIVGFALWGLCALFVLLRHIIKKTLDRRALWAGAAALSGFVAFFALLTPALWSDPVGFVSYLLANATAFQRWENFILFRGVVFDLTQTSLPWYYLPYMILATTPLWALLMIFLGQASALFAFRHRFFRAHLDLSLSLLLCTLLWALPLGFALITRTSVYNGWRHFYFLYGPMLVLAAYGACAFWRRLGCRKAPRMAFSGLLALCMALTGAGIASQHPFQYAYYQPLVQLRGDHFLELDYWNVSAQNALARLAEQQEGELRVGYADLWSQNAVEHGIFALPDGLRGRFTIVGPEDEPARWVLANPTYALFSGFIPSMGMREAIVLTSYGRPIMQIYEDAAGAAAGEALP